MTRSLDENSREPADTLFFMANALSLAEIAGSKGEVPVGALVVKDGEIIGRGYNLRERDQCVLGHAELVAIKEASAKLGTWRLSGCTLFVTLEPCLMCAGAIYQSRLTKVVFGAFDPKAGAMGSLYEVHSDKRLNHRFEVETGLLGEESASLLKDFFRRRRVGGKA